MKKLCSLLFISALMTGCGNNTQTVEYFSQHLDEAKSVVEQCEKDSATLTENCKNAKKAITDDSYDKFTNGEGISY